MVSFSAAPSGALIGAALDDIVHAVRGARRSIALATPFLSHQVAALLVRESIGIPNRRLLIALNDAAVEGGYLDPRGVEEFLFADFEIRCSATCTQKSSSWIGDGR